MPIQNTISNLDAFASQDVDDVEEELSQLLSAPNEPPWVTHASEGVAKRLQDLVKQTKVKFVAREREAEAVAAGLLSGVSSLLLGPPGTAKSALVKEISSKCGMGIVNEEEKLGGYFEYLLTNHTMPEEIFGGPNLESLSKGKFERNVAGKLPCAEIAFLDEVFRGGSHILNTLLTVINEKRYDRGDGSGSKHVPLLGVVGAANTPPQDPDLEAFFDRFPIRIWLRSVFEQEEHDEQAERKSANGLLKHSVDREVQRLKAGWNQELAVSERRENMVACTNDFRFARLYLLRRSRTVGQDNPRFFQFDQMFRLVRERIRLSDRTYGQLWLFGAALDWLRGKNPVSSYPDADGHLEVFRYVARSSHDVAFLNDRVDQHTRGLLHTGGN